jgi:hypothetical protein
VPYKNTYDTSNNKSKWNRLEILQKIREEHSGKARNQGIRENNIIVHGTLISEKSTKYSKPEITLHVSHIVAIE